MGSTTTTPEFARRLEGKVAIITGGASGVGASSVNLFHQNGAIIVIADIQDDKGQALANKLGKNVSYVHCDISKEDDVINLIDTTIAKHGKLDIMYNNAGVLDGSFIPITETEKPAFERLIQINLIGSYLGAKHAARVMVPQKSGCILFTTSACTQIVGLASAAYAATKYGILGLAKTLTAELGEYGIRVNCVSPYGLATGMTGCGPEDFEKAAGFEGLMSMTGNLKGGVLKADGVAMAALYLASDEASYVSGLNLVVDGGFSVVNPTLIHALRQMQ